VIVASPTLSQGLNLNAAILLVPSLYRSGEIISGEEFANVAGRAGRAFVDVEGLVVHVMFEANEWRFRKWRGLVASARARSLESGLIQIVAQVIDRLAQRGILSRGDAFEYLANAREAWQSMGDKPADQDEDEEGADSSEPLAQLVEKLDATVLGLVKNDGTVKMTRQRAKPYHSGMTGDDNALGRYLEMGGKPTPKQSAAERLHQLQQSEPVGTCTTYLRTARMSYKLCFLGNTYWWVKKEPYGTSKSFPSK
jgi:hypothetical protein